MGIFYRDGVFRLNLSRVPFVGAFGADEQALILINEFRLAAGAWRTRHKQWLLSIVNERVMILSQGGLGDCSTRFINGRALQSPLDVTGPRLLD